MATAVSTRPGVGRERLLSLALLLPSLAVFALFLFWPLVRTFRLSTTGQDLFGRANRSVGLANFKAVLHDPEFTRVLGVTAGYVLLTVLPSILLALLLALLLQHPLSGLRVLRSAFAMPFAYSVAAASVVFAALFNPAIGIANYLVTSLGFAPVDWLTKPGTALISIAITTIWMSLGYNMLVLLAGIGGVDEQLYEAARLDGAGTLRIAWSITIPMITPTLFFLVVVDTIHALQSFGQIHLLTRGGPTGHTTTLVYWIYHTAFANGASDYGTGSAQAIVLLVVVIAVTAIQFGVLERKVFYR
ncbi:carbohydrate ABC transporter permease [Jatrophihabitans sp.]|uniref:carbohydrate ABC transporter permease n=1 Tax=Jatrophihabitans sp. TaxID=1932789 RepID=UPI002F139B68